MPCFICFFFLMIRRPPRSTLFPTRRSSDLNRRWCSAIRNQCRFRRRAEADSRSEEHTSELQSRQYLVCRLLLEKKKKLLHRCHRLFRPFTLEDRPAEVAPALPRAVVDDGAL